MRTQATIRARILDVMRHFSLEIDARKTANYLAARKTASMVQQQYELWVIPTDEELQIAEETRAVLGL